MLIKNFFFILFFSSKYFVDAVFPPCPNVAIQHGKVRYSSHGRKLKFSCFKPYVLIGNDKIECENAEWDHPIPVCARKNCDVLPKLLHGKITYYHDRASAKIQCQPDFTLIGSSQMHCTENMRWNDTVPECRANSIHQFGICDFEPNDTKQCQWVSKHGLFNWTIMSTRHEDHSYMPVESFPSHDHTLSGPNSFGHFLYLESLFAQTKTFWDLMNTKNATAKYISPLFPPFDENEPNCLIFYLYANGSQACTVEVSINKDSIWRSNCSLGTEWKRINIPLRNQSTQFRITIEGKGELGNFSKTAIDDLRIAAGEACQENYRIGTSVDAGIEHSVTKPFSGTEEYDEDTEESQQHQPNQSSFSILSHMPKFENTNTFTTSTTTMNQPNFVVVDSSTIDSRSIHFINIADTETSSEENNSFIKVEDSNSPTEIIITQNNVVFHNSPEIKVNGNDIPLVDEIIHTNSTHDHENDDDLQLNIPITSSSPNDSSIKQDDEEFNKDMTILQHRFPNETEEIPFKVSLTNTTHLISVSNNTVVKSNDAEDENDHQEENGNYEIEEKADYPWHPENKNNDPLKNHNQNNELKYNYVMHSENGQSNYRKIFWAVILTVSGVLLLVVLSVLIYIRHYGNRRKEDTAIQLLKKDDSCSNLSRTKVDVLMLKNVRNDV